MRRPWQRLGPVSVKFGRRGINKSLIDRRGVWAGRSRPTRLLSLLTLLSIVATTGGGCTGDSVKKHALLQAHRIETELVRGVSRKADVLRLLGEPDGAGELGGFDRVRGANQVGKGAFDAWYYESNDAHVSTSGKATENLRVLLVFFNDEKFSGFYWFTIKAEGKATWSVD